jgi:hypothetical protein
MDICWGKESLLIKDPRTIQYVQLVNEKYAFYQTRSADGSQLIECAFPIDFAEMKKWLEEKKIPYGHYVWVTP